MKDSTSELDHSWKYTYWAQGITLPESIAQKVRKLASYGMEKKGYLKGSQHKEILKALGEE